MFVAFPDSVWILVKVLFLFAFGVYLVFAAVVVKQIYQMTTTLQVGFEFPIKMLGWIHLFIAVAVLLFALLTL